MKKLLALVLAMLMVFSLVACGDSDSSSEKNGTVHTLYVFQNTLGDIATEVVPAKEGGEAKYNAYSMAKYIELNNITCSDDYDVMFVAGSDQYGGTKSGADVKAGIYICLEGDNAPWTRGEKNTPANMPYNCEFILFEDSCVFILDCNKTTNGKISNWIDYMDLNDTPFDDAENYVFTMTDGSTKTVAAADIDTIDLHSVKTVVAK